MNEQSESPEAATGTETFTADALEDRTSNVGQHLIVGIGASAGGLAAFQSFLTAMPPDTGMGFVLIQHLDPDYDSALAEILSEFTAMPVQRAIDGTRVAPNTVSVIPPNAVIKIEAGILRVGQPETPTARRSSVDTFLLSLAEDQGENAVAIILSGFGSDGTAGIAAVKEAGGLTLSEAEFDHQAKRGMPQNATAGGFVDNVLQASEMPAALVDYQRIKRRLADPTTPDEPTPELAERLTTICAVLHSRLGRDFGQYKTSTLMRRVRRRMQVLRIDDADLYIEQLRNSPDEPELLFREILISVTRFFRDAAIFRTLADAVLTNLVAAGAIDAPIRVWVAGCATGEEAYSLAILFKEAFLKTECPRRVTIFATDIDDRAVDFARAGLYGDAIEADVDAERLERHFVKEGSRYRIAKHIREMCVFSAHDLVKDPPFSKLDLISCRNLLIYFEPGLQQRVMATFHYGLKVDGILLLGPSETVPTSARQFAAIDKRSRIYRRLQGAGLPQPQLTTRTTRARALPEATAAEISDDQAAKLMAQFTPAFVVVDAKQDIQRFSGAIAKFLEPVSGNASLNLFRLLHPELRTLARSLLRQATEQNRRMEEQASFTVAGRHEIANLIVEPINQPAGTRSMLIAFQEIKRQPVAQPEPPSGDMPVSHAELLATQDRLQTVTEELETANEELQSSNEEFQSVNEELHSTVEELETSKEELQSINEELHTVNAELNNRAESLVRSNSDLINLFASTSVATLFLDNDLNIRRFTPSVADIFNVRDGDEGRPITDFSSLLAGDPLTRDATMVLRDLSSIEREVDSADGRSTYLLRMRPYRDLNNVIDGVSITLVDISERKRLDRDRAHLAAIVASSEDGIVSHDLDGLITSWNAGAEKIYGYKAAEVMGQPMSTLLADEQVNVWPANLARLRQGEVIANLDVSRVTKDHRQIHVALTISPIRDEKGAIVGASAVARDIAERKAAEERALLLMAELDHRVKNILAVVSSVVTQALRAGGPPDEVSAEIEGRIMAIARAHNLLTDQGGIDGSLGEMVSMEVKPFDQGREIRIAGPDVVLTSRSSLSLALVIHELATNAAKYGGLSVENGRLDVIWQVTGSDDERQLEIDWVESGGPPVSRPTRRGFGTKLIEVSLIRGLGAKVNREFLVAGVRCRIAIPLKDDVGTVRSINPPRGVQR
ncbi:CheR family methyltransferase [Sphingomonas qilianensis]|uniref:CheR family methyltransferase n=1 Tax=Sphingomonas qilianensis TaxID=1736690 RepID=A0ABU9XSQ5_9SPHN